MSKSPQETLSSMTSPKTTLDAGQSLLPDMNAVQSSSSTENSRRTSTEDDQSIASSPLSSAVSDLTELALDTQGTFKLDSAHSLGSQQTLNGEVPQNVTSNLHASQSVVEDTRVILDALVTAQDWQPRRSGRNLATPKRYHNIVDLEVLRPSSISATSLSDLPTEPAKRAKRNSTVPAQTQAMAISFPPKVLRSRATNSTAVAASLKPQKHSRMVLFKIGTAAAQDLQKRDAETDVAATHTFSFDPLFHQANPFTASRLASQPSQQADPTMESIASPVNLNLSEELVNHSKLLTTRIPFESKPEPRGQPSVWADDRSSLCETLQYYRAYQGACYTNNGRVFAMMFDESSGERDFMDAEVIVSRAGGGMTKTKTGKLVQVKEQKKDYRYTAMLDNVAMNVPVVVICGDKNPASPSRMPHRYNVLGFFKVTNVFTSVVNNKKHVQYRFEKLNPDVEGWWEPRNVQPMVSLGELPAPLEQTCNACNKTQEQIFLKWMCLEPDCARFWTLSDGSAPKVSDVDSFNPCWLKKRTRWENEQDAFDINPNPNATPESLQITHDHGERKGICCPQCGMCNSRYMFTKWVCDNPACDWEHIPVYNPTPAQKLRLPEKPVGVGSPFSHDTFEPTYGGVKVGSSFLLNHRVNNFSIHGLDGNMIVHMIANEVVLAEPHGPDDMFQAMQQADIGLERRYLGGGKAFRMCAFSVNHGFPYKFVGSVPSRPFTNAPWVIAETRTQLNFFSSTALGERFPDRAYNELLTFAYLEGQKINYHDDGETGLGPTVATYSLGAPAWMRFRMKGKYWTGIVKKTGDGEELEEDEVDDDNAEDANGPKKPKRVVRPYFLAEEPLPNTPNYAKRKAAFESLQGLSKEKKDQRCWDLPRELELKLPRASPPLISVYLAHGDKIIMHGEAIQKYFEHEVEPIRENGVRFANTCREILPHHLPKEQHPPEADVPPDTGFYDGSGLM